MGDQRVESVWYHAYEEDDDARLVYHGPTHEFPRSRRPRESLTLESGGRLLVGHAGPTDNLIQSSGRWTVTGNLLTLQRPTGAASYEIETATEDTLVLRRRTEPEK